MAHSYTPGWKRKPANLPVGSRTVRSGGADPGAQREYDRSMAMARTFGIDMEEISFSEARRLWPLLYTDDLSAVYYQPHDGQTSPH